MSKIDIRKITNGFISRKTSVMDQFSFVKWTDKTNLMDSYYNHFSGDNLFTLAEDDFKQ